MMYLLEHYLCQTNLILKTWFEIVLKKLDKPTLFALQYDIIEISLECDVGA